MPYISGIYTGVPYEIYGMDTVGDVADLDAKLQDLVDDKKQDSVVALVQMPTAYTSSSETTSVYPYLVSRPSTLDGYTPRNKKLLTYPYNFLCVDSLNDSRNYRYEWFDDPANCSFFIFGSMSPNPEIVCAPENYNGHASGAGTLTANVTESVTCSGFPQCAFSIDAYRAWLAQKATGEVLSMASTGAGIVAGAAVGGPAGAAVGGVLGAIGIGKQINSSVIEATQGAKSRGSIGSSTEVATRQKDFYFKRMGVTREYAQMIDDYFDRFGYAVCRVKVPNINVRTHWTYTKTQDCSIEGNIPADDLAKIKSIFNKGITFWANASEVGNYRLDNSATAGPGPNPNTGQGGE